MHNQEAKGGFNQPPTIGDTEAPFIRTASGRLRHQVHLGVYGHVLEQIAVRYAEEVDDEGFFLVGFEDNVSVPAGEGDVTVRVRDVLDRSGIAYLDPVDFTTTRYRFDPFWVHAYLVEKWNQRIDAGYAYSRCD